MGKAQVLIVSGYILKPFFDTELRAIVEMVIQLHGTASARRTTETMHAAEGD